MTKQEFAAVTVGSTVVYNGKGYTVRQVLAKQGAMRLTDAAGVRVKDMTSYKIMATR